MASQLLAMSSTHMSVSLLGADSMITNRNTFNRGAQHQKLQYCSSSSITIFPAASTRRRVIRCETMTSNTSTSDTQTNLENNNVFSRRARQDEEGASPQEMCVYEINERDRDSPVVLNLGRFGFDWTSLKPVGNLGILVPFTNKLYDGSLTQRLGITAGMCMLIRHYPEKDGDRFEATYSFYFGDYGQISVQGPYKTYEDTVLAVTGGTGIFTGVYGTVRLHQVTFPTMLFYTFKLQGIAKLPKELTRKTVPPTPYVRPTAAAVAARPHATAPHYTN